MKKILLITAALACFLLSPRPAAAQGGYFGVGTFSTKVLSCSFGGCPIGTIAIANVGQSSHWLTYCVSGGTASTVFIQLEASFDGTNWFAITEPSNPTSSPGGPFQGCQILEASGYFPQLRANLAAWNGPTLNIWYSATQTAISSDGLGRSGKASQPVTFVPAVTISNTALKSTPAALAGGSASIYEVSIFNPNAATVYVVITPVVNTSSGTTSAVYGVAAGASRDIDIPNGFQTGSGNSTFACATSPAGTGDPTTGCVVTIHLKGFGSVTSGTAQSTVIPN
ncbi:MAG TPA: hypothetical protein VJN64_11715 [Terriglobales bacterium]|nr:hypothetical protein [Terriglobales bacterium]